MSVFAVPRSTAIAFAGKSEPDLKGQRILCQSLFRNESASLSGKPNASATAGYTTLPSMMLSPFLRGRLSRQACFHPRFARRVAYGKVAFVGASVEVRGTPPGMFATP